MVVAVGWCAGGWKVRSAKSDEEWYSRATDSGPYS